MSENGWSPEQMHPWCEHGRANNPSARVPGFCCWCVSITVHCLWIPAFLNVCLSFLHSLYPVRSVPKQCRPWQVAPARGTWLFPLVKGRNAPMRSDQVKMRGAYSAHQVWTMGQAESRASCIYWCFGTDFGGLGGGVWTLQLHWVLDCSGDILLVSRRRGRGVWLLGEDWIDAWPSNPNVFLFLFLFCSILFVTL